MALTKEHASRSQQQGSSRDEAAAGPRLIKAVRDLAIELHPENRRVQVTQSSDLDRDLGFDSLSRAELMLRLEQTFDVKLPENLLVEAETVRDLHKAITASGSTAAAPQAAAVDIPTEAVLEPVDAGTLIDVLEAHAGAHPDRTHVAVRGEDGRERTVTYGMLHAAACKVAAGLLATGVAPGDRVAVMLPTGAEFFYAFFGVLFSGGIPVPVYPPMRMSQLEDHLRRQAGILRNARASLLITDERILPLSTVMRGLVEDLQGVTTVERLSDTGAIERPHAAAPGDTALIQYTSGSTGDPKGVVLTHANLLANIRAMGTAVDVTSSDIFVSWLPLYHDMGLIGAWLGSLYYGIAAVIMSPVSFLAAPRNWLNTIKRYGATLTASPNFGFELSLKRVRDRDLQELDLSSLRMVVNGAEPISPDTLRRFTERFGKCGLAPGAVAPVYGLAESSVGLAFPPPGRVPIIDRVDRDIMSASGEARQTNARDATALEFVACGQPLPGHEIRIVDPAGRELPERRQGRLEFRGPSTTAGYYRDEEKTRQLFNGDWLDSGDLAYVAGGDVYITGRIKDIIIRAGRNIYPHELEQHVGALDGIRKGCVAVFPSKDPRSATETLVVLAETRETGDKRRDELRKAVSDAALDLVDLPPDEIVLLPPRTIPKTSSGKIRRAAARELYETHELTPHSRSMWWQLMRLSIEGAGRRFRSAWSRAVAYVYAGYWWTALCGLTAAVWLLVLSLSKRRWRHAAISRCGRLFLRAAGIRLVVEGAIPVPDRNVILVNNHASYLDSLILCASLPGPLSFVAKQELETQLVAGPFLKRLATVFVRRSEREAGLAGMDSALAAARRGERLVWFPEGTLTRKPGLMEFRLGPFLVAGEADMPIIPVAIKGTRSILRGGQWFPHRGEVTVTVGEALMAKGNAFADAIDLRDRARRHILDHVGEPDLSGQALDRVAL